jgi:PIN domain nuclease of toxin-antitoxin system
MDEDSISAEVSAIIKDYSTTLYTSSAAMMELLLLFRIGKLRSKRFKSEKGILSALKEAGIEILYFNRFHFAQYVKLEIADSHKDMNDHTIIAQAISDKMPLISSDRAFKNYVSQGLDFVFNKR